MLQILDEAHEINEAADRLIEAADWAAWQFTGEETRNSCTAGYKAMWPKREGFPSHDYFAALNSRLENVIDTKMSRDIQPIGGKAGDLTPQAARWTGLKPGTAVAIANVGAYVAVPATTVVETGRMVLIVETGICHMVLASEEHLVPGICGHVEDGILPGLFGHEAGQLSVGDHFAWFVENAVPAGYLAEARRPNTDVHTALEHEAAKLKPGESGLLTLDWWNGNLSVLVEADLTGMMTGQSLLTKAPEMYRALIEATAFGTRVIVDALNSHGVPVNELLACGGLSEKNKLLLQTCADVTGRELKVAASAQTSALGSAMFGAVAAGQAAGGYDTIFDAAPKMAQLKRETYKPNPAAQKVYDQLYAEYVNLHDYFGRGANDVLRRVKKIKAEASS